MKPLIIFGGFDEEDKVIYTAIWPKNYNDLPKNKTILLATGKVDIKDLGDVNINEPIVIELNPNLDSPYCRNLWEHTREEIKRRAKELNADWNIKQVYSCDGITRFQFWFSYKKY